MARQIDWEQVRDQAMTRVQDDEDLRWVVPAVWLDREWNDGGGHGPGEAMLVFMAIRRLATRRRRMITTKDSLFPLDRRMFIGVTDRRLLIWSSTRRWRLGEFLGPVSRASIVDATAPTRGAGWRSVVIDVAERPPLTIKVPNIAADQLAELLAPPPH